MSQSTQSNNPSTFKMGAMQDRVALPYQLSLDEAITEAWQRVSGSKISFWGALGFLFLIMIGFTIINILVNLFYSENVAHVINFVVQIISSLVFIPLTVGVSYLGVRRAANLPIAAAQIFTMYRYFWRLLGMLLLQYLIVYALVFLFAITIFIFPAYGSVSIGLYILLKLIQLALAFAIVYISISFVFSFLLIVEKKLGVLAAYKASFLAFSQHWFKLAVGLSFMFFLYIISFIFFVIGAIWVAPMFFIFIGVLYRNIFGVEEARQ